MKSPKGAPFSTKGCYLKMNLDGSVSIVMAGAEVGQGLRSVVRQVAGEALKIAPERIRVYTEIDTQYSPYEWQTIGSMFTTQGGRAIIRAAEKLIALLKRTAAQVLKTDEDYLEYDGEYVFLKNDPDIRVAGHRPGARLHHQRRHHHWRAGPVRVGCAPAALFQPGRQRAGQHAASPIPLGRRQPKSASRRRPARSLSINFTSVFDVGQVINPLQIRGSVMGGVLMAIGATLYEKLEFDEQGRIKNPHFYDYHLPTFKEAPRQTVEFVETPDPVGPFGARGIGEHPVIGPAPAILNAIYDAIGADFSEIPVTPDQIKQALEARHPGNRGLGGTAMLEKISFMVNGNPVTVEVEPEWMLLDVIRDVLYLTGTKCGCDNGTCGTCMVVLNGRAVKSCTTAVKKAAGARSRHRRRHQPRARAAPGAGSAGELGGDPVRLLHPWDRHGDGGAAGRKAECRREGNRQRPEQAPVPLHRLRADPRWRADGAEAGAREAELAEEVIRE